MSLSVVATLAFVVMAALAVTGAVRRVSRRSWLTMGTRLLRRHRWARRTCLRLATRRLRRHPALAAGLVALARRSGVAS